MASYTRLFEEAIELGTKRKYAEAIVRLRGIVSETDEIEEAFLYLGRSYHAVGAYPQAIDMLRRFTELRPESPAGHFFLGRSLLSAGEFRRAAQSLRTALELRDDIPYARGLLGYIYLKIGRSDFALDLLAKAVEEEPNNRGLYKGYLNALLVEGIKGFKRGQYQYAEEVFSFIVKRGEKGILPHLYLGMIHRLQGDFEGAIRDYRMALEYSPEDRLLIYRIALLLQKSGRVDEAAELFAQIGGASTAQGKVKPPQGPEADRHLAKSYFERREFSQSLHYALQILHKNRNDATMHLIAGESYREMGKFDLAHNHFLRILDSDRNNIGAHYGLALIHWQVEEYELMLPELRKIERLEPGSETVHYYTVLCSWKLGRDPEVLLPVVQEAVRSLGPDPFLLNALAETYKRGGYRELSLKWYYKILDIDGRNIDAYRGIFELHEEGEELAEYESLYESYFKLVPDDNRRRRSYIRRLFKSESYDKAIATIESYLSLEDGERSESSRYFQRMRAICYRKTGDYETAAELYRRLLAGSPSKEELLRPYIYCLEKSGRRSKAAETAEKAVYYLKNPSPTLCLIAGVLRYKEGNKEKALEHFRSASELEPRDWRAFYNIGEIYRLQGMEGFASRFLQKAASLRGQENRRKS